VSKIDCKKATNEKVHPVLAYAYGQQFSGNRSSTRVDPAVESLETGQLLSTPRPSANDLGASAEQKKKNNIPLNFKATTGLPFP
jgi:hypothetical protein